MNMVGHLTDTLALPVAATLLAGLIGELFRRSWRRARRPAAPQVSPSDSVRSAAADLDASAALAAASLQQLAQARRFRPNAVRRVEDLADHARERFSDVGRPYSTLRISADQPLLDQADALMSALGDLGAVLERARRFPVATSSEWAIAWDSFEVAQRTFRDVVRGQLGARPYRRTTSR